MTRTQTVTATPAALAGVAAGTGYGIQVVSGVEVYLATAASVPNSGDSAFIRRNRQTIHMRPGTGESIYAWTGAHTAIVAYEESI